MKSEITYREMRPEDIQAGLSICRAVGWNQLAREWELFLKLSDGCRVAVDPVGKVVGTVTTLKYQNHFSWIGMLLVNPQWQGRGIGKQLMQEALQILSKEETVKLDATPAGREVYLKFGFADEYRISRMMLDNSDQKLPQDLVRSIKESDWNEINRIDNKVFGADRKEILWWMNRAKQFGLCIGVNGIDAYCFGREGYLYTQIGPVVANNFELAQQIISSALLRTRKRPLILDIPHVNLDCLNWLRSLGFEEKRVLFRMYKGTNTYPGDPKKQFAILGPEFG